MVIDTRHMNEAMQRLVDGYVHILPQRTMHKHWIQADCWCDPVASWSEDMETVLVKHKRTTPKTMEHIDG